MFGGITENVQIDDPYDGIEVENFNTMKWNSIYLVNLQDKSGNGFGDKILQEFVFETVWRRCHNNEFNYRL